MVVRDEEEILAANLDYHLAQGVDAILVIDHGSSDGTPDILQSYARTGAVRAWREEDRAHRQADRVSRLLAIARDEHQADWVIHADADEFWIPLAGSLRDVFASLPSEYGYVQVPRSEFLPSEVDGRAFHERMLVRRVPSLNLRGTELEPKVAQRPEAADRVAPGNHSLLSPRLPCAPDIGVLEVLHYPIRSFPQLERKVLRNGVGHEVNPARVDPDGCDQLELLAMHRAGALGEFYAKRLSRAPDKGQLVEDERLTRALRAPPRERESPLVQHALRRAWAAHLARDATEHELRSVAAQLQPALDALDQTRVVLEQMRLREAELARELELIRSSATMRLSAPARRVYHRLRRGSG
jgi:hypothetical protein